MGDGTPLASESNLDENFMTLSKTVQALQLADQSIRGQDHDSNGVALSSDMKLSTHHSLNSSDPAAGSPTATLLRLLLLLAEGHRANLK